MEFNVIASGSKGNANIVRTRTTNILIDCGITGKYLRDSLAKMDMDISDLDAVLVTHSHSDHIRGLKAVAKVPLYASFEVRGRMDEIPVEPYQPFMIGDIEVTPIKLSHDAPETVGYILKADETLVSITDTGYISQRNRELIRNAEYYIFEANHDLMRPETRRKISCWLIFPTNATIPNWLWIPLLPS